VDDLGYQIQRVPLSEDRISGVTGPQLMYDQLKGWLGA
jgi:hypothetical protein